MKGKSILLKIPLPTWLQRRLAESLRGELLILFLHAVVPTGQRTPRHGGIGISAENLAQGLRWLQDMGFRFLGLSEACERLRREDRLTRTAVLTTDDGFSELYSELRPIQQRLGIPACHFVSSRTLDNQALQDDHARLLLFQRFPAAEVVTALSRFAPELGPLPTSAAGIRARLRALPPAASAALHERLFIGMTGESSADYVRREQPYLSREQVLDMIATGDEFGAHTLHHPDCSRLGQRQLAHELGEDILALNAITGQPVRHVAYPYGLRPPDPRWTAELAREHGLWSALGTAYCRGANRADNSLAWERQFVETSSLSRFQNVVLRHAIIGKGHGRQVD